MSDMKCPFCRQELREIYCYGVVMGYICPNPDCKKAEKLKGNTEFWQELIRTRKALETAVDALKRIAGTNKECDIGWKMIEMKNNAHDTLNQIKTALEQKD